MGLHVPQEFPSKTRNFAAIRGLDRPQALEIFFSPARESRSIHPAMSADHPNDREDDPVWTLLDKAPPAKAGSFFSRNVMREIRLAAHTPAPWWKRLLAPLPLSAGAVAAAAAFVALVALNRPDTQITDNPGDLAPSVAEEFDVDQGLLIAAVEDPSLFSDEEVLALLY
jgi:hypothetical protein